MSFPTHRPRRLRKNEIIRTMFRETHLSTADLVYPLFVCEGSNIKKEIPSMPGCHHYSVDRLVDEVKAARDEGIPGVLLFGIPASKDARGSGAYASDGIVQKALAKLKSEVPGITLIADVCLCEYTDHGHCGVIKDNDVDNDPSLELIAASAVSLARAGADIVAPSDMMDGRVGAIRSALDASDMPDTIIMAYAAKFASAYYGPFREAADSAPQFGDRRSYQMDPANGREAMREIAMDIDEGADVVMVKPALAYMDLIREARDLFEVPIAAYNVSGEYSMIVAASEKGWVDRERVVMETLMSMKRAGADLILTYFAREAARILGKGSVASS
jgi:porphobilinogen synthase